MPVPKPPGRRRYCPGEGKHGVQNPLPGQEGLVALEPLPHRPGAAHGPVRGQGDGDARDCGNLVLYAVGRWGRATPRVRWCLAAPARGTPGRSRPGRCRARPPRSPSLPRSPAAATSRCSAGRGGLPPERARWGPRTAAGADRRRPLRAGVGRGGRTGDGRERHRVPAAMPPCTRRPGRSPSFPGSRRPRRNALHTKRHELGHRDVREPLDLQQGTVHSARGAGSAGSPQPLQVEVGEGAVDERADGGVDAAAIGALGEQSAVLGVADAGDVAEGVAQGCRKEAPFLALGAGLAPPGLPCCAGLRMPRAGLRAGPRALSASRRSARPRAARPPLPRPACGHQPAAPLPRAGLRDPCSPSACAAARSLSASAWARASSAPRSGSRARDCLWARSVMGASPR